MSKILKRALRFVAFASLVLFVFLTNIVHKLGFTSESAKDDTKKPNDLFASFSSVPSAYADTPIGSPEPNTDAGPCGCSSAPH